MAYFSKEEMVQWYNELPRVPLGVKVVLSNAKGEILLSKPNYRPGWQLIGGTVDENESPLTAICREIREEVCLDIDAARLRFRGVGYTSPRHGVPGVLTMVFAATLTDEEVASIHIQKEEISALKFVTADHLPREDTNPSLAEIIEFHNNNVQGGYVEDGVLRVKI